MNTAYSGPHNVNNCCFWCGSLNEYSTAMLTYTVLHGAAQWYLNLGTHQCYRCVRSANATPICCYQPPCCIPFKVVTITSRGFSSCRRRRDMECIAWQCHFNIVRRRIPSSTFRPSDLSVQLFSGPGSSLYYSDHYKKSPTDWYANRQTDNEMDEMDPSELLLQDLIKLNKHANVLFIIKNPYNCRWWRWWWWGDGQFTSSSVRCVSKRRWKSRKSTTRSKYRPSSDLISETDSDCSFANPWWDLPTAAESRTIERRRSCCRLLIDSFLNSMAASMASSCSSNSTSLQHSTHHYKHTSQAKYSSNIQYL